MIKSKNPDIMSTTTFAGPNEKNKAEFEKEVEKAKEVIKKAMELAKDMFKDGLKEAAVDEIIKALEKAGYTWLANSLKALAKIDPLGVFSPTPLGDPTDVAGLLTRQGEEFRIKLRDDMVRKQGLTPRQSNSLDYQLKDMVERSIHNYLTSKFGDEYRENYWKIDIRQRLVFPDSIRFEYNYFTGEIKIIEK